jgi:signal transduction histidine kinase/ActR/RegA family two-component response regulator
MSATDKILPRALLFVLPPTVIVLICVAIAASTTVHETASAELNKRLSRAADQSAIALSNEFKTIIDAAGSLAANDLIVNSIADSETRTKYIPILFGSLRIPGPSGARISLTDYRGRTVASNGVQIAKVRMKPSQIASMITTSVTFSVSSAGMIVAVPIIYGKQPEGLILVEYDPDSLTEIIKVPVGGHEIVLRNGTGDLLYASTLDLADGNSDRWITRTESIPSFSSLRLTIGEPRDAAFAAVDRQGQFLLVAIAISFIAVIAGIGATAYLVRTPMMNALSQVKEANKTKSLFLASMSHEIRTPLNGVLGMASLLNDETLTAEQRERVETIQSSGETLLSLLNDILDLSKIEAGHLDLEIIDFNLPKILDEVRGLWEPQVLAKGLEFECICDGQSLSAVRTDPTRIKQIIFNFISNALKFTESGQISIRISQKSAANGLIETRFEVHDTGIGIDTQKQQFLFETFKQADNSITRKYGGTGLGLAISKNLAEAMGGRIGMDSTAGSGSCFWFTTVSPVGKPEDANDETLGHTDAAEGGDRKLRILIAEDNKVNQAVIRAMIERADHRADAVGNGLEAVSAVMRAPYDLILMDVQMPEMDGITATKRIREIDSADARIPIIALTANAMKGDRELYLESGMDDYVSKPIDPKALFSAIRRTCGADVIVSYRAAAPKPTHGPVTDQAVLDDLDDLLSEMDEAST